MTDRLGVFITAIGGGGVGEQTLKALRIAGGYRLVGGDARSQCPQFELVDEAVVLPSATSPDYVDAVLHVAARTGVQAVFPGSEPELRVLSDQRDRIHAAGLFLPINPKSVIDTCMDKLATAAFLDEHGFASPRSLPVATVADLAQVDFFPVVVKPAVGSGGSRDVFIAQTPRELELIGEYIIASGSRLMVQEYVGTAQDEYTVGVLHDMAGRFLNSIGLRRQVSGVLHTRSSVRNVTGRRELGELLVVSSGVSHGHLDRYPEVTGPCEQIAAALGVTGAVNIQCRLVEGEIKVFEINPRLSGTTSLRALVGYNEPDVLLRTHLLGETVQPRFPYRSELVLRSLREDVVSAHAVADWRSL
jgi:carbamoyl-phosphate synthase large subunit